MFSWLKSDPLKKLNKQYQSKLEEAMKAQRNGDMRLYAGLTEEAEAIRESIESLERDA